jgi:hypothetical protein
VRLTGYLYSSTAAASSNGQMIFKLLTLILFSDDERCPDILPDFKMGIGDRIMPIAS